MRVGRDGGSGGDSGDGGSVGRGSKTQSKVVVMVPTGPYDVVPPETLPGPFCVETGWTESDPRSRPSLRSLSLFGCLRLGSLKYPSVE